MTDNTDEEHLDNPTNAQSENLSDEINPTKDIDTVNPNQEIETMEVHHHPDLHHKPKKWKEYFFEFLMIFLAVTMGFIAENIREYQTEKKVGKELIYSLLDDLKADTAAFNYNARFWTNRLKGIDSLRYYIQPSIKNKNNVGIYFWVEQMFYFSDFKYHDGTIQQLRNTGNFRLIKKNNIIDSLIDYDASIKASYFNVETTARTQYLFLRHMQTGLFNSFYFKGFSSQLPDYVPADSEKSYMIKDSPDKMFEYFNELYNYKLLGEVQIYDDKTFRDQAIGLISLIQKEYDL